MQIALFCAAALLGLALAGPLHKTEFITDGRKAALGQFPYNAFLDIPILEEYGGKDFCGGSILNEKFILTAAHCVEHEEARTMIDKFTVAVGLINRANLSSSPHTQIHHVVNMSWFPRNNDYARDLAVLELATPIQFNEFVRPIRIVKNDQALLPGGGTIVGFGSTGFPTNKHTTNDLLYAHLDFVNNTRCAELYDYPDIPEDRIFCSGGKGKSTGAGDSGGPLAVRFENGEFVQTGLTSFGRGPAETHPSAFTRISYYCTTIEEWTRGAVRCT